MARKPLPKVSTTLPPDAREALIAASKMKGSVFDRQRALQETIERIQRKYPHLFNTTQGVTP